MASSKNVHDIRSFMGLIVYCQIVIEKFSRITHPITTLQNKSVWFIYSPQCQESFDKLKYLLTTTPILKIVDPSKYFVVCTDASKEGLGEVLTQEGHLNLLRITETKGTWEKLCSTWYGIGSYHSCP